MANKLINRIKRLNIPLILGLIIVSIVFFVVIYGYQLVNLDPFSTYFGLPKLVEGDLTADNPPHAPNEINIWGTDIIGRDVYSRVIYGARLTIQLGLFISLFRLIVALPFSFFAGFSGKISSKIIDMFNTAFSAIPALIVSYIILRFEFIKDMEIESAIIAYIVVLTFIGWGRVATILRDRIKEILSYDFIKGEIAIGKNKLQIAIQNVLPHLSASIIILYFIEVSRVLLIIAELGVLGVYIGKSKVNLQLLLELGVDVIPSHQPEWGAMLASSRYAITAWKPWNVMYPALALFISVLGFNLLGEGLKLELSKRTSKFIIFLKHIPRHLSPKTYIYQINHFKKYKKNVIFKTALILGIVVYSVFPSPKSKFGIDERELYNHLEEFSQDKYGTRGLSSEGKNKASEYILGKLENSNIEPIFEESYTNEDTIRVDLKNVRESQLYIKADGEKISFKFQQDYNLSNLFLDKTAEDTYSGKVSAKILTYNNYKAGNYDKNGSYFLVLGQNNYNNNTIINLMKNASIDGLILSKPDSEISMNDNVEVIGSIENLNSSSSQSGFIDISVTSQIAEIIKAHEGEEVVLDTNVEYIDKATIKNIGGVIRGKDPNKPPMILACNYDYKENANGPDDKGLLYNGSSVAANLEIINTLKENNFKPERDIYFLFFDGSVSNKKKGMDVFRKSKTYENFSEDHIIVFLNYLGYKKADALFLDTSLLHSNNKFHYNFIKILTKRGKDLDINIKLDKVAYPDDGISTMHIEGNSGISIASVNDTSRRMIDNIQQSLNVIDKEKLIKQTQLIIDSITMYDYELERGVE